jgi:hypothetical protein
MALILRVIPWISLDRARKLRPSGVITLAGGGPAAKFDAFLQNVSRDAEIFFQIRKSRRSAHSVSEIQRARGILGSRETPYNHYPFCAAANIGDRPALNVIAHPKRR